MSLYGINVLHMYKNVAKFIDFYGQVYLITLNNRTCFLIENHNTVPTNLSPIDHGTMGGTVKRLEYVRSRR